MIIIDMGESVVEVIRWEVVIEIRRIKFIIALLRGIITTREDIIMITTVGEVEAGGGDIVVEAMDTMKMDIITIINILLGEGGDHYLVEKGPIPPSDMPNWASPCFVSSCGRRSWKSRLRRRTS